jgi:hypothetical protein
MIRLKLLVVLLFAAALLIPATYNRTVHSQSQSPSTYPDTTPSADDSSALARTTDQANKVSGTNSDVNNSKIDWEGVDPNSTDTFSYDPDVLPAAVPPPCDPRVACVGNPPAEEDLCVFQNFTEAPAAFDNQPNDLVDQNTFDADKKLFSKVDEIKPDGLGPVYNAQSCRECHQNPVTGAISETMELRAGHVGKVVDDSGNTVEGFIDAPGGSLIDLRATNPKAQERVPPLFTAGIIPKSPGVEQPPITHEEPVRTLRTSLNTLGDGFVESVANGTLESIRQSQKLLTNGQISGLTPRVPVLEANIDSNPDCADHTQRCVRRIGRFGWKDQQPSLLSFSGDAYLNEMGITNRLLLNENTSLGRFVGFGTIFDPVPDNQRCDDGHICGEDPEFDIGAFTEFMRATKAPPPDTDIQNDPRFANDIRQGKRLFVHMPTFPGGPPERQFNSCSQCHVPIILTAHNCTLINGGEFSVPPALGDKIIRPFSDFILHDVGTGDGIVQNAGQQSRFRVRTPPLWGVRTRPQLLHNGTALTFNEAILAHAGEANDVINLFRHLSDQQRKQIIMYLESL